MALGSTQNQTEINASNISRARKGGRCVELKTLPPSCVDCLEIGESQLPGNFTACKGIALPLPFTCCYGADFITLSVCAGCRKETSVELSEIKGEKGVGNVTLCIRYQVVPLLQR